MKPGLTRWRANFFAGLAVLLPAVISFALLLWLFGTVANITDTLLWFLPRQLTHRNDGAGSAHWYWSLAALALAILLISSVGALARHYLGRKLIETFENILLRVPLVNKVYATVKQVNEAFSTNKKSSFRQVVLVEFPRPGLYSIGFVTSEQPQEIPVRTPEKVVSVFIPTTPNPTSGFLVFAPEHTLTKLNMSVADGIKFIISLGAVAPDFALQRGVPAIPPQAATAADASASRCD